MCVEKAKLSWDDIDRDFQYFLQGDDKGRYDVIQNFKGEYFYDLSEDRFCELKKYLDVAIDFNNLCERVAESLNLRPDDDRDLIVLIASHYAFCTKMKIDSNYWSDKNGFLQLSSLVKEFVENGYDIEECLKEKINCFGQLDVSAQIMATMKNADRIRHAMGW